MIVVIFNVLLIDLLVCFLGITVTSTHSTMRMTITAHGQSLFQEEIHSRPGSVPKSRTDTLVFTNFIIKMF